MPDYNLMSGSGTLLTINVPNGVPESTVSLVKNEDGSSPLILSVNGDYNPGSEECPQELGGGIIELGISRCPECQTEKCARPVQEIKCMHLKCRECFITSEEGCRQCAKIQEEYLKIQANAQEGDLGKNDEEIDDQKCLDTEQEVEVELQNGSYHKIYLKHGDNVFEFEDADGNRSITVLNDELLEKLCVDRRGLPRRTAPIVREDDEEIEEILPLPKDGAVEDEDQLEVDCKEEKYCEERNEEKESDATPSTSTTATSVKNVKRKKKLGKRQKITPLQSLKGSKEKLIKRKNQTSRDPVNDGKRPANPGGSQSQPSHKYYIRQRTISQQQQLFKCPRTFCSKTFTLISQLKRHMTAHTTVKPKRRVGFTSSYVHLSKPFFCMVCKESFRSKMAAKKHSATAHPPTGTKKSFECNVCNKKFPVHSRLVSHSKIHEESSRRHKCPDCPMAFYTPKDLRRHYLNHTGEMPFQCEINDCSQRFRRKDNFVRHLKKRHNLQESAAKFIGAQQSAKNK